MASYAFLDENNIVVDVITGKHENEDGIDWEEWYGNFRGLKCKRTSYNTFANKHALNGTPFRKNYAGIGFFYDEVQDAFIAPKPFPSWNLNLEIFLWQPPKPMPEEGLWEWNEFKLDWVKFDSQP